MFKKCCRWLADHAPVPVQLLLDRQSGDWVPPPPPMPGERMTDSLVLLSRGNIPSCEANSVQTMKMADAFAQVWPEFKLICGGSLRPGRARQFREIEAFYGVAPVPAIILPLHARPQPPGRWRKTLRYELLAPYVALWQRPAIYYTRNKNFAGFLVAHGRFVVLEIHSGLDADFLASNLVRSASFLGIITISDRLAEAYVNAGLSREKVIVLPSGVAQGTLNEPIQNQAEARQRCGLPAEAYIVTYTGALYDYKGVPLLLEAAARMGDVLFVLVGGNDEDIANLRAIIRDRRLDNVRCEGFHPQGRVKEYLAATDALVLPTSGGHELSATTSPLKLFEYMAARRPLLASDLPNIAHVVTHLRESWLFPPDNLERLEEGIRTVREDKALAARLAANAFDKVASYTWENRARQIKAFVSARLDAVGARSA